MSTPFGRWKVGGWVISDLAKRRLLKPKGPWWEAHKRPKSTGACQGPEHGEGGIGDTPDSLSCPPPVKKESWFSGDTGPRGTKLRDTGHSTAQGGVRHGARNRRIRQRFSTERWDSPAPHPGSAPGPGTAQLTPLSIYPTQAYTRAEEKKMPPCRKCPTKTRKTTDTDVWGFLNETAKHSLDYPTVESSNWQALPYTQSFQQPRNGLQGSLSMEWKPLALKTETPT